MNESILVSMVPYAQGDNVDIESGYLANAHSECAHMALHTLVNIPQLTSSQLTA